MSAADLIQTYLLPCMYTQCLTMQINNRLVPRHFVYMASSEGKQVLHCRFTDSYRKDAASSGFTLVSTSFKLKGLKAGQDISS